MRKKYLCKNCGRHYYVTIDETDTYWYCPDCGNKNSLLDVAETEETMRRQKPKEAYDPTDATIKKTNYKRIALVMFICSLLFCCTPLRIVFAILSLIFSILAIISGGVDALLAVMLALDVLIIII